MLMLRYADAIATPVLVLMRSYGVQVLPIMLYYAISIQC